MQEIPFSKNNNLVCFRIASSQNTLVAYLTEPNGRSVVQVMHYTLCPRTPVRLSVEQLLQQAQATT